MKSILRYSIWLFCITTCSDLGMDVLPEDVVDEEENTRMCFIEPVPVPTLIYKPDQRIDSLYTEIFKYDYEGNLIVRFIVDETGKVQNPEIVRGLPPINSELLSIVSEFEFEPAMQNGLPLKIVYLYPFFVRLSD